MQVLSGDAASRPAQGSAGSLASMLSSPPATHSSSHASKHAGHAADKGGSAAGRTKPLIQELDAASPGCETRDTDGIAVSKGCDEQDAAQQGISDIKAVAAAPAVPEPASGHGSKHCQELQAHVKRDHDNLVVSVQLPDHVAMADVCADAESVGEQRRLRIQVSGYDDVLVCDVGVRFEDAKAKRQRKAGLLVVTCPLESKPAV